MNPNNPSVARAGTPPCLSQHTFVDGTIMGCLLNPCARCGHVLASHTLEICTVGAALGHRCVCAGFRSIGNLDGPPEIDASDRHSPPLRVNDSAMGAALDDVGTYAGVNRQCDATCAGLRCHIDNGHHGDHTARDGMRWKRFAPVDVRPSAKAYRAWKAERRAFADAAWMSANEFANAVEKATREAGPPRSGNAPWMTDDLRATIRAELVEAFMRRKVPPAPRSKPLDMEED